MKKKIGMIGGIGPESTVDYYQRLVKLYQQKVDPDGYPELVIDSINMTAMLKRQADGDWDGLARMLLESIQSLSRAGADFAFIASNTPHIVFEVVKRESPIPLVSIVEAARGEADRLGLKKLGLLGTRFTMRSDFYQAEFRKSGMEIVVPNGEEQQYIHEKLFSEIERGIFREDTRQGLLAIAGRLAREEGIDSVILGCTELPLILTQEKYGIPYLNTTRIHVDRIMEVYLAS